MSIHDDMFDANADTFGEAITVTPPHGEATDIDDAIWQGAEVAEDTQDGREHDRREETVLIPLASLATALEGSTIARTATGETFIITKQPRQIHGRHWECKVTRSTLAERYRGMR